jgi:two-component system phosphate regulon sensor histidine kinase PhoR
VTRVTGREGINVGYIVTFHDVTEQRQLEEMKLDFVSMAAHELRTPLTAIVGYLAVFTKENEGKIAQDQLVLLNRVNISAQRLRGLVENLLSVTKIERGSLTMSPEPIDWVDNVTQVIEEFQLQANEEGVALTFTHPDTEAPKIHVDTLRINEVLINLISNAITYTPKGGSVEVGIQIVGNEITTFVKDDGPGIPETAIPHLFTKFFRVAGKLEQGSKGTGLGLYISKTIIELHKGKIWVESILGKGTTFYFTLTA